MSSDNSEPQLRAERSARLFAAGDLDEAAAEYRRLAEDFPDVAALHINLGAVERARGRPLEALAAFDAAVRLGPADAGLHFNRGNACRDLGRTDEAEAGYRRALDIDAGFAPAANNLGDLLIAEARPADALPFFQSAVAAAPDNPKYRNNLGNACKELGDLEGARRHLSEAVRLEGSDARYLRNLAAILQAQGDWRCAEFHVEAALGLDTDDADAHCLKAFSLLGRGDYGHGWDRYEWRWKSDAHEAARNFRAPIWDGSPLGGKSILVWGEQAVGDEIMFASMLPDLMRSGARIHLECEYRLAPLLRRSFPDIRVVARTDPPSAHLGTGEFDWQAPIGSLARHLRRSVDDFPAGRAYLAPDRERSETLRRVYRNGTENLPLVGISWKSRVPGTAGGRSTGLEDWLPVLSAAKARFVCLQYGDVADEIAAFERDHGIEIVVDPEIDPLKDMDGFTAQMAALDLVLTTANTTAHVGGGLGVPTWVLVSRAPDWRWRVSGNRSPWYASVELYRQTDPNGWQQPIAEMRDRLASFAGS